MKNITCYCIGCPGSEDQEESSCVLKPGAQCFAAVEQRYNPETRTNEPLYSAGCLPPDEQSLLQCKGDLVPNIISRSIKCCDFTDFCNKNLTLPYKPAGTIAPPNFVLQFHQLSVIVPLAICVVACISFIICLFFKCKKSDGSRKCLTELWDLESQKYPSKDFRNSSGSGSGKALLVRSTIGRQVRKERLLGKGRYCEKWVVTWKGERRLVMKTFSTLEEDQWSREVGIYLTGLGHENVLGLFAVDTLKDTSRAILTHYFENGSLHDHLKLRCFNDNEILTLARSAATAVECLHTAIPGTCKRPAIVHRNITSKNFLINHRQECVICDFDVALHENEILDSKIDLRVGTPRYTAPEVVNENIDVYSFEAFKMADIYSLGLVLWEMCRRHTIVADDYALPFSNHLSEYPTMEDMKDLFATKQSVQEILVIPENWERNANKILNTATSIIKECVHFARIRPTALRIKKRLFTIEE